MGGSPLKQSKHNICRACTFSCSFEVASNLAMTTESTPLKRLASLRYVGTSCASQTMMWSGKAETSTAGESASEECTENLPKPALTCLQ